LIGLERASKTRIEKLWKENKLRKRNSFCSKPIQQIRKKGILAHKKLPLVIPLPKAVTWISLKRNVHADDDPVLRYVPYFGDDDKTGVDVTAFEHVPQALPPPISINHKEKKLREVIEIAILRLKYQQEQFKNIEEIATVLHLAPTIVEEALRGHKVITRKKPNTYEEYTESFRELFCRRCYRYDCAEHGARQPSARMRNMDAVFDDEIFEKLNSAPKPSILHDGPLSIKADSIFLKQNAKKETKIISSWLLAAKNAMEEYHLSQKNNVHKKKRQTLSENDDDYTLLENTDEYKREYKRAKRRANAYANGFKPQQGNLSIRRLPRSVIACDHFGECKSGGTCSCILTRGCCDKQCSCSPTCRARYPGCRCKPGTCRTRSCECVSLGRECDADLCRCCDLWSDVNTCQNRVFACTKYTAKRLALGRSSTHGWGTFCLEPVKCGELVGEYRGELLSHEEADRRGKIYDKLACSFLFNLDDSHVVDATRMGTKIKFANHSEKDPNLSARIALVNGDHRIALIAGRDIQPHEELYFNYSNDFWNAVQLESPPLPSFSTATKLEKSDGKDEALVDKSKSTSDKKKFGGGEFDIFLLDDDGELQNHENHLLSRNNNNDNFTFNTHKEN